ncbi:ImmA/IrrE family metallo-endopeptidase [Mycolicibacterium senegalense]|uniref:ImmA/IrrE family metallo-endopeptidase n=1 Tax=Mycolicibacterium senegalense TaxID=1796 RepID=UPI00363813B2
MLEALSVVRAKVPQTTGAHGRLHASTTGWTIYRRSDLPWRRGRFTEAHELGHILLYEKLAFKREWLDDLHSDAAHLRVEKLCDIAAAELLVPGDDLTQDLAIHPLETLGDYHWFYDRYMTSHRALLRRVAEVATNTAMTVWAWQTHPNGANWRIRESYCQHLSDIYIPRGISRRRLSPDVVGLALDAGAATAPGRIDVGRRRYIGIMTALHPGHRNQTELPIYHGQTVRDEQSASIYVLHRSLTTTTGTAVPTFRRRGRAS